MTLLAAFLLGIAVDSRAVSFHAPTTEKELADLQSARTYLAYIQKARDPKSDFGKRVLAQQSRINELKFDINATEADKARANKDLEVLRRSLEVVYDQAIHAVIRAYGIAPDNTGPDHIGILAVGGRKGEYIGKPAKWNPVFWPKDMPRTLTDAAGNTAEEPPSPEDWHAATSEDGQVTLGPNCFSSPAFLAGNLVHESVHFEQRTTKGRRDMFGPMRAEEEAFGVTLSLKSIAILGLTAEEVQQFKLIRDKELDDIRRGIGPYAGLDRVAGSPAALEPVKQSSETDFYGSLEGLKGVSEEAQRLASAKAHEGDYTWEQVQKESAEWMRQYDDDVKRRYAVVDYLGAVAGLACSDPEAFQRQIDRQQFVDAMLGLDQIVRFKNNRPENCKESVLDSIRNANGPVSPATILSWAQRYHAEHPGFFQRLANDLAKFAEARDKVAAQSSSSGSGESRSSGSGSREPPEPRSTSSGGHSISGGGAAVGQARGISAGSMHF